MQQAIGNVSVSWTSTCNKAYKVACNMLPSCPAFNHTILFLGCDTCWGLCQVEILNKEKDQLVCAVIPEFGNTLQKEKRMQVWEVCRAMQASTDTEMRLTSHLEGKRHLVCFPC
jgi:hypothetical protein